MDPFKVESIHINAAFDQAFAYIAAAENLPKWTRAFQSVLNGRAVMATPAGTVEVGLKVHSSPAAGTIDWKMTFPDGNEAAAYSRLVRQPDETCIYSFVLLAPPVPLAQLEGALDQQVQTLRQELRRLKQIVDSH
jgi:hypothetical protein